tara:strand:- start:3630 stop:3995 length:366 start_codon:yes stop_codon:yes gene_type:complete
MKNNIKSQRQLRVGEQLKKLISEVITMGNFQSNNLRNSTITITEVNISPDLKKASIYVVSRDNKKNSIKYLNNETFYFKREIARKLKLRFVPKINFIYDNSFEYSNKIEQILNEPKVIKDL